MMIEIWDSGHGITAKSLDLWNTRKHSLGKITRVQADKEYIVAVPNIHGSIWWTKEYSLVIHGEKGIMRLSGCNCGYVGEGPSGTREILEELGVPYARKLTLLPHIDIEIGGK